MPLWRGEPPKIASPSNTVFTAPSGVTTGRIKVYLDTKRVAGWNEIDAVQLVGRDGSRQWAKNASASSSYGGDSTINLVLQPSFRNRPGDDRRRTDMFFRLLERTETTGLRPQ